MEGFPMALGKRESERQAELFITHDQLPKSVGHVFYVKLNQLLAEAGFDPWIEELCEPYYGTGGRPSVPPGNYFRMLLVGYFEGIQSQRGIAWRCADSLSLRRFLGLGLTEETPDHSSLSYIRKRLPQAVHDAVFEKVLAIAHQKQLLVGTTVAVDSTTLEANAAMKSIVRRDTGEDYQAYLTRLMRAEGLVEAGTEPNAEERRKFDKTRKKTASNAEWVNPNDPDAKIAKMKDGTTHLAYKAEHVIDLDSGLLVAAVITPADEGDTQTLINSVTKAEVHMANAGQEQLVEEVVADKGYHSNDVVTDLKDDLECRTYIPEPELPHHRTWTDKPPEQKEAVYANRRRTRGARGRRLQRQRSEQVERSFAHVCETGGARRTWLRGIENVAKRYSIAAAAHNLGCLMRKLFKMGTPRGLQQFADTLEGVLAAFLTALQLAWLATWRPVPVTRPAKRSRCVPKTPAPRAAENPCVTRKRCYSTGC
jgi:transposase